MTATVIAVARDGKHRFSKQVVDEISIVAGLGVDGDAHQGEKVKHRSRVRANPDQPNLRQVHLIHDELLEELSTKGFNLQPGALGENLTTRGIDLLQLPKHTRLKIGSDVELEVTGLRNPCVQIENYMPGLLSEVLVKTPDGGLIRKTGIMSIVLSGGTVRAGDKIEVILPPEPQEKLACV